MKQTIFFNIYACFMAFFTSQPVGPILKSFNHSHSLIGEDITLEISDTNKNLIFILRCRKIHSILTSQFFQKWCYEISFCLIEIAFVMLIPAFLILYARKNNNNLMFARYESKSFPVQYSHLECIICIPFSLGLGKIFPVIIAKHNGIFFFLSLLVSRLQQEHFTDTFVTSIKLLAMLKSI